MSRLLVNRDNSLRESALEIRLGVEVRTGDDLREYGTVPGMVETDDVGFH
ncbi:hypothetical protein [Cohnella sp.]